MMIPALEWQIFYEAFGAFASMARKYHFYEDEVSRMEASLIAMSPVRPRKEP